MLKCLVKLLVLLLVFNQINCNTLVLLEGYYQQTVYSQFLKQLEDLGFNPDIQLYNTKALSLGQYGRWNYQNLILLTSTVQDLHEFVMAHQLKDFIDNGNGNLIMALDYKFSKFNSDLSEELGIDLDYQQNIVLDNYNKQSSKKQDGQSVIVQLQDVSKHQGFVGMDKAIKAPILFKGVAQTYSQQNRQVISLMRGPFSCYSKQLGKKVYSQDNTIIGSQASLVTAYQAFKGGRATVIGSTQMLQNQFYNSEVVEPEANQRYEQSGNKDFINAVLRWTFKRNGQLRARELRHRISDQLSNNEWEQFRADKNNFTVSPNQYRIKDKVIFAINIDEMVNGQWVPFRASDVQVELQMLDPHVRTFLYDNQNGVFSAELQLPDVYGVFKFVIDYQREGYNRLLIQHQIPIRPYKHNEFERFIQSAFLYYAAAFSSMISFFILMYFIIYVKD